MQLNTTLQQKMLQIFRNESPWQICKKQNIRPKTAFCVFGVVQSGASTVVDYLI